MQENKDAQPQHEPLSDDRVEHGQAGRKTTSNLTWSDMKLLYSRCTLPRPDSKQSTNQTVRGYQAAGSNALTFADVQLSREKVLARCQKFLQKLNRNAQLGLRKEHAIQMRTLYKRARDRGNFSEFEKLEGKVRDEHRLWNLNEDEAEARAEEKRYHEVRRLNQPFDDWAHATDENKLLTQRNTSLENRLRLSESALADSKRTCGKQAKQIDRQRDDVHNAKEAEQYAKARAAELQKLLDKEATARQYHEQQLFAQIGTTGFGSSEERETAEED